MLKRLRNYWYHLAIWAAMFTYLFVAPELHLRFVLEYGKPVQQNLELPAPSDQILFAIDRLDPISIEGQDLFYLWGWAFFGENADQALYDRLIVLNSDKRTYFFTIKSFERPDVQKAFEYLNMDLLNSGFSTFIAKEGITPDTYHIGILFIDKQTNTLHYIVTNKVLIRTANHLELQLEIAQ